MAPLSHGSGVLEVGIAQGHIKKQFTRVNEHTQMQETFDPKQIFMSPSAKYCEVDAYCVPQKSWIDTDDPDAGSEPTLYDVKTMFQMRVMPGSYAVGHNTTGSTNKIDPYYSNSEVEWYTKGEVRGAIILTGLLVKMTKVSYVEQSLRKLEAGF